MSPFEKAITQYETSFKEKLSRTDYNLDLLVSIAKSLGPSIYEADSAKVACSEVKERRYIEETFLVQTLGLTPGPELMAAIRETCQIMGSSNRNKYRVVFYYLLVERFDKADFFLTENDGEEVVETPGDKSTDVATETTSTTDYEAEFTPLTHQNDESEKQSTMETSTDIDSIIQKYALAAAAAGLVPIPLLDLASISTVQYRMIKSIGQAYPHIDFVDQKSNGLIAAVVGGITSFELGWITRLLLKGVPIIGPLVGGTAVSGFAYYSTMIIGEIFDEHFSSGGDLNLEQVTINKMKERFRIRMNDWRSYES
ncbi:MAG: DUF2853 family protein [Bacteroidota bacterium]